MIPHIDARMKSWATWALSGRSAMLGYPKECNYTRMMARSGGAPSGAEFNEDAWEIEQAVKTLDSLLQVAVKTLYLGCGTVEQKARDCGCSKKTLFNRIDAAHVKVMDWLNEHYAEHA